MSSFRSLFRIPRVVVQAFAFASLLPAAFAATYYVSPTGSDSNPGTLAAPFAGIMQAQSVAAAGDTVVVRGGTYSTFTIAFTDANYNYVHRLNKSGITYEAYPGETPLFNFSSVPTNLRVCGFHVTGSSIVVKGFHVTGVQVGSQKQSECWRIDGSAAQADFYDCVSYNNAANGFYWTNRSRGSATRCDAYNNIGTSGDSIGNTDGFGAHGNGVVFRYCRAWNNSDDGFDSISSPGANVYDHCWSFNHKAGGDSNGFKVGGFGADPATIPPTPVPAHIVTYCLAAFNNAHGFYANHQPGQSATWTHNTAFNNASGNYNMLERTSDMAMDIAGFREVLHYNIAFTGTTIKNDNNPPEAVTNNSWTIPGLTVDASDFQSIDWTQLAAPRSAGGNMPFIAFMHLTPGSDLAGLGCFEPPPSPPAGVTAHWVASNQVNVTWTASPTATNYFVKRATTSGGPYTAVGIRVTGTTFSDTTVTAGTTYYYVVSAMDDISYDEGVSSEASATFPNVLITGITTDTGRSATDGITNDPTLVLSGVAGAGDAISVSKEGVGVIGTTTAEASGLWTFDYSGTTLAAGSHGFRVEATAAGSGDTYLSDIFAVTIDTAAPDAPVISSVGTSPYVVLGTAEAGSEVVVTRDGGAAVGSAITGSDGNWSVSGAGSLTVGPHAFVATATDAAGNTSAVTPTFAVDTSVAAPVITAAVSNAGNLADGANTSDNTLSLSGTSVAGATVTVSVVGGGVVGTAPVDDGGAWLFDYTGTSLPEGATSFVATASVGFGNSAASAPFTVNVDTIVPAVQSIVRQVPTTATVTSAIPSLTFRVTFSENVTGVDAAKFTLVTADGAAGTIATVNAVNGSIYDVTINSLTGSGTLRLDYDGEAGVGDAAGNTPAAFTTGEVYTRVGFTTGSGTWIRPATGGLWSEPDNWQDATIPSGSTHTANFATLDVTATNTVRLDSPRTVNALTFGDTATGTSAGWILDNNGDSNNVLTVAGAVPTITVNALGAGSLATVSARIAGSGGITKAGAGTLALSGNNPLSGAVFTTAGVLSVANGGVLNATTTAINAAGAQLQVNGGAYSASGTVTVTGAANTALVVNSGTASLQTVTFTATSLGSFRVNGGTVNVNTVTIPRSSDAAISYTAGFILTGGTTTVGTVNLGTGNSNGAMSVEGGTVTATGVITVGNQATAGRGGGFRVTGGRFTSTNTAQGLVLSKNNGATANTSEALFNGGIATLEKLSLGFDATVVAGAATVTLNGGTLYLGSGGIVKNGADTMNTPINLTNGTLGAKASWSFNKAITLTSGNNVTLKAADEADASANITLSGPLTGAGGFAKTGGGTLTLSGANTFTGSVALNAGTLAVSGSLAVGGSVSVNNGGVLAGTGTVNKAITLNSGGAISPAAGAVGTLSGASVTWNGGGSVAADLGATSDSLALTGALTKGSAGSYQFVFAGSPAIGSVHTLATFGSTTFAASDFSFAGLTGASGQFSISGNRLLFTVTPPPDAAFKAWAASLPAGQQGVAADPDGDGVPNLLEFVLGQDGAAPGAENSAVSVVTVSGVDYPAITYQRRIDRGGVNVDVLVSPSLDFTPTLGAIQVSVTPAAAGFETVVVRSAVPLSEQPSQFFTLTASVASN